MAIKIIIVSFALIAGFLWTAGAFDQFVRQAPVNPFAAPSTPTVEQQPAPKSAAPEWRFVAGWTGNGMKDTESFTVMSREWRVTWKTTNEVAGSGVFSATVHDENDNFVALIGNVMGTGGDISYVRSSPGRHYLKISSANVNWNIQVEDDLSVLQQ